MTIVFSNSNAIFDRDECEDGLRVKWCCESLAPITYPSKEIESENWLQYKILR